MYPKTIKSSIVIVLCLAFLFTQPGIALITGEHGNHPIVRDHGWPAGSLEVANLKSRLGYWEGPPYGGGEYHFLYRCENTESFNEALKLFARIESERLELIVHNGPEHSFWLEGNESDSDSRVDWTFTVWTPENWERLFNSPQSHLLSFDHPNYNKPVAAPKIDVYIGGGSVIFEQVKVPENVTVIDTRPCSVSSQYAGAGLVRGKVFDMETSEPIVGAEIILAENLGSGQWKEITQGRTDANGFCEISKIPSGYYEVRIKADGHVARKEQNYNNKRPAFYQFKLSLARPFSVSGVVIDVNGNPVEGAKVFAFGIISTDGDGYPCSEEKSSITDEQGHFEIHSLPKGLMNIRCRAKSLYLKDSILNQYTIPSENIKLTMTGTGSIKGKVISKDSETILSNIHVHIQQLGEQLGKWGGGRKCEEDGSFEFADVPPGEYLLSTDIKFVTEGDTTNAKSITVQAGKSYQVEIVHVEQ